jgi:Protein of unknown function (DUF1648).
MKLKITKLQVVIEIITFLFLIAMFVYLRQSWSGVPDRVPGHYDAAGQINRWGNKSELLTVPIISAILYILLTAVTFFPAIWNVPATVTEENRTIVYEYIRNMMCVMKLEMVLGFTYISYKSIKLQALSSYFFFVFLVVIFGTMAYYLRKTLKVAK